MPKFHKGDLVKISNDADGKKSYIFWARGSMDKYKGSHAIVVDYWLHWRGFYVYTLNIDRGNYYWAEDWLEKSYAKDDFILEE